MALDAWSEMALVTINPSGKGDILFQTLTETIDMDVGAKGVDYIPLISGGRVAKLTPQEDITVTMELYPLQAGTTTWPNAAATTAALGVFDLLDGEAGQSGGCDHTRLQIRLTVMWTNNATANNATAVTIIGDTAMRLSFADGYLDSVKPSFTDGILKYTITAKFPAYNKANLPCMYWESTTSTVMTVFGNYTAGTAPLFKA